MDPDRAARHRGPMNTVVVTGAAGPAAERVVASLAACEGVDRVVVVAPRPDPQVRAAVRPGGAVVEVHVADVAAVDLERFLHEASALVHLGAAVDDLDPALLADGRIVDEAAAVLRAAAGAAVDRLVLVSSAAVYGAWANNPVPLTEAAIVKPPAAFRPAVELAEAERRVSDWSDDHPGASVTVLRAAPVVADDHPGWLARALRSALSLPVADRDPATQYLHADDLGAAIVLALAGQADGVLNVAPDGAISGSERRALDRGPRLRLPEPAATRVATWRWQLGLAPAPPELIPFVTHPWVVANDRLRAAGWVPGSTNEEAYVAAFRAGPWATLSPRRRQELSLGAAGAGIAGLALGAVVAVRRRARAH
jgi:nucleoside-diphosphate-sugar epimerase